MSYARLCATSVSSCASVVDEFRVKTAPQRHRGHRGRTEIQNKIFVQRHASEIVQPSNSSSLTSFRSIEKMNPSLAPDPNVLLDIRHRPISKIFAE